MKACCEINNLTFNELLVLIEIQKKSSKKIDMKEKKKREKKKKMRKKREK